MNPALPDKPLTEKDIFLGALAVEGEEKQEAYLNSACQGDEVLLARVVKLLKEDERDDDFFGDEERSILEKERDLLVEELRSEASFVEGLGSSILQMGDYELIEEIGRGSMGVVYRARQKSLNREVALKVILGATFVTPVDRERFQIEAEATAGIQHRNIVPVYEIGEYEGHGFYSMAYVPGGTLSDHIGEYQRDKKKAVRLIAKLATTIQLAHSRGILHRDLKPDNILIDESGEPLVSDFGLAYHLEKNNSLTLTGKILGTPQYMSPEQAEGSSKAITMQTDIYSLGAMLYELLAGAPLFRTDSVWATLKKVKEEVPPLLKSKVANIDRDLEIIVAKCLEKKPSDRYSSASLLAADLNAWLEHRPIAARPPSSAQRFFKWVRRKPSQAALMGSIVVFLLSIGIGGYWFALEEAALREVAEEEKEKAELNQREAENSRELAIQSADLANQRALENRRLAYASNMRLIKMAAKYREPHSLAPQTMLLSWAGGRGGEDLRGWEWYYSFGSVHLEDLSFRVGGKVNSLSFSSRARRLLVSSQSGTIIRNPLNKVLSHVLRDGEEHLYSEWSRDGESIVTLGLSGRVTIWNTRTAEVLARLPEGKYSSVSYGPEGELATLDEGSRLAIWKLEKEPKLRLEHKSRFAGLKKIAWSPDGLYLAAIGGSRNCLVWSVSQFDQGPEVYQGHRSELISLAWQNDSSWLATGSRDSVVRVWGVPGAQRVVRMSRQKGGGGEINHLAWSADGGEILYTLKDRKNIGELDMATGHDEDYQSRLSSNTALAWSAELHSVATGDADGLVRISRKGLSEASRVFFKTDSPLISLNWSPDSTGLLCCDAEGRVTDFNSITGDKIREMVFPEGSRRDRFLHEWSSMGSDFIAIVGNQLKVINPRKGHDEQSYDLKGMEPRDISLAGEAKEVVVCGDHGQLMRFSLKKPKPDASPKGRRPEREPRKPRPDKRGKEDKPDRPDQRALSRGGRLDKDRQKLDLELPPGEEKKMSFRSVSYSPNNELILATGDRDLVCVWSRRSGELLFTSDLTNPSGGGRCLEWHPQNRFFATGGRKGKIAIWSVDKQKKVFEYEAHRGHVAALAWNPKGRRLASAGKMGEIHIWDWESGQSVLVLEGHSDEVAAMAWDKSGRRLASVSYDGTLRVWDATAGILLNQESTAPMETE